MGLSDELRELATLHEGGKLTDEEFVAAKQATISSRTPSSADEEQAADLLARLESLELIAAVRAEDFDFARVCLERTLASLDDRGPRGGRGHRPHALELHRWLHDRRFARVRDEASVATMDAAEQNKWQQAWQRVRESLRRPR